MPVEVPVDEQVARYRWFRGEVTVGDLEQFFRLDAAARAVVADERRPVTKPGVGGAVGHGPNAGDVPGGHSAVGACGGGPVRRRAGGG